MTLRILSGDAIALAICRPDAASETVSWADMGELVRFVMFWRH